MSPDGSKIPSPEERLLRLIRGKGSATSLEAPASGGAPPPSAVASPAVARAPVQWGLPSWWLTGVNVLLGAVLAIEIIVWIAVATKPEPLVQISVPSPGSPTPVPSTPPPDSAPDVPPFPSVATHPVFQTPTLTAPTTSAAPRPSQEAKALAARLSLLGIVAGTPSQAIIEDSQTTKTFFVSVGQSVVDGLVVTDVGQNRVTLDLSGEKIELSL